MIAAFGTLAFLATLWLLVVVGAQVLEESGAKIAAAFKGEPERSSVYAAPFGCGRGRGCDAYARRTRSGAPPLDPRIARQRDWYHQKVKRCQAKQSIQGAVSAAPKRAIPGKSKHPPLAPDSDARPAVRRQA